MKKADLKPFLVGNLKLEQIIDRLDCKLYKGTDPSEDVARQYRTSKMLQHKLYRHLSGEYRYVKSEAKRREKNNKQMENKWDSYGPGFQSLFRTMRWLMILAFIFALCSIPILRVYRDGDGSILEPWTLSLGHMPGSKEICDTNTINCERGQINELITDD